MSVSEPRPATPAASAAGVDFLGRGFAWPMQVDHRGAIRMSEGVDNIEQAVHLILSTAPGERVFRPDFGCAIWEQLFEPINANSIGLMAQSVREALGRWEPRIVLDDVIVTPDNDHDGRVRIEITYAVRDTNDRRNLVFPFYVIPQDGEEQ